jgi:hypothetical protein
MQRIMTDFRADDSFEKATEKILEYYGIEVPPQSTRNVKSSD